MARPLGFSPFDHLQIRAAVSIGRLLGVDRFLSRIERATKRLLKPGKRGPKPKANKDASGGVI